VAFLVPGLASRTSIRLTSPNLIPRPDEVQQLAQTLSCRVEPAIFGVPIGLHMAFDRGETYFYGVGDSGQTLPGHLLNASSSAARWLSGGTVDPEGCVLCTLLIIVVWPICAGWLREIKYPTFGLTDFSGRGRRVSSPVRSLGRAI